MSLTNPNVGLQRDADTVALYKSIREFNPPLGIGIHESGDGNIADSTGNYPLKAAVTTARISNGPLGVAGALANPAQFSRAFCSNLSGFVQGVTTIDQAYNDAIRQSFTQQFVINPQWTHTATRGIYGANNEAGSGSANDWLARLEILSNGRLQVFWENNDNNYGSSTPTPAVAVNKWQVVTVTWETGTGYIVEFWVHELNAGVVTQTYNHANTDAGTLPNSASGVGNSQITYGRNDQGGGDAPYIGLIAFGRIYKGILTDQEIADQAEELLITGTLGSVSDANDLHRHEFNEPPDWIDESDYGLHCNSAGIVDYDAGLRHIDIVGSGGRGRRSTEQGQRMGHLQVDKMLEVAFGPDRLSDFFNDTFQSVPEYTFQWICLWSNSGNPIIAQWDIATESLATNFLFRYNWAQANGDIAFFAERGSGTNIGKANNVTDGAQGLDRTEQTILLTLRVGENPGSPGVVLVRMSVNDQLDVASFDMSTGVPQGGTNGIGFQWGGPSNGYLQEFKFSFGEVTDQQILDDFARIPDREGSGSGVVFVMRGFDQNGAVNDYVYWDSSTVDSGAVNYSGSAGPVVDVVVFDIRGE
ncbi:MAG: hypothetical protein JRE57_00025 [Deltaproteobacteria bacterium]|nr:hypothetical protein [Deltaproteobacteria bacterium]